MPDEKQNDQKSRTMPVLLVGGRYDGAKLDLAPYTQVIDIAPDKNVIVPDHMAAEREVESERYNICLLYTSPSPRDRTRSRMPSSA